MVRQFIFASSVMIACWSSVVQADDDFKIGPGISEWSSLPLSKESGSSPEILYNRSTQAQRLRQQRALFQEQQRLARIEANQWMGYEPLRPSWPTTPSMASGYRANRVIIIPYLVP